MRKIIYSVFCLIILTGLFTVPSAAVRPVGCADNTWTQFSIPKKAGSYFAPSLIWDGTEVIAWQYLRTGYLYNPLTETSREMNTSVPIQQAGPITAAVWTGQEMIVFGNSDFGLKGFPVGAAYNSLADSWRTISITNAPIVGGTGRLGPAYTWTGSEMIVWGGNGLDVQKQFRNSARYNPATDSWSKISTVNAPPLNSPVVTLWTGSEMLLIGAKREFLPGGQDYTLIGGAYNPTTNSWRSLNLGSPSLSGNYLPETVWTGSEMILLDEDIRPMAYDPSTDTWRYLSTPYQQIGYAIGNDPVVNWTGNEVLVWDYGGDIVAKYNPTTDSWTRMKKNGSPVFSAGQVHSTVWTGSYFIVIGNIGVEQVGVQYCYQGAGPTPVISNVSVAGKNLIVMGSNYADGASILIDGQSQRTIFRDASTLTGKKAAKRLTSGLVVSVQVQNSDGSISQKYDFIKP